MIGFAQTSDKFTSTDNLYKEGKELFQEKNYAAALPALKAFVKQKPAASLLQDAEYMLASSAYELKDKNRIEILRKYLDRYPDTPYANRIYALLASCYFYEGKYDEALALFNSADLGLLGNEERDDCTYQLATCYLKTDNLREAAIWFETLRSNSPKYAKDCDYYLSYIRYTQKRYNEALKGFLPLQDDSKYKALVPYYIAEIYAQLQNYDKAQIVAQNYLSAYPNNEHAAEMYRILGDAYYHFGQYHQAVEAFNNYLNKDHSAPRRDALYMLGTLLLSDESLFQSSRNIRQGYNCQRCPYSKRIPPHGALLSATGGKKQSPHGFRTGSRLQCQYANQGTGSLQLRSLPA